MYQDLFKKKKKESEETTGEHIIQIQKKKFKWKYDSQYIILELYIIETKL